jgi:hypothetical protein
LSKHLKNLKSGEKFKTKAIEIILANGIWRMQEFSNRKAQEQPITLGAETVKVIF